MPKGIFNPYAAPKKEFRPSVGDNPWNTEYSEKPQTDIRLDGGKCAVVFKQTTRDELTERIGQFMEDVSRKHKRELAASGILLGDPDSYPAWKQYAELAGACVQLPTPKGVLRICTNKEDEDEAFRRLGRALLGLGIQQLLDKHQVQIIVG